MNQGSVLRTLVFLIPTALLAADPSSGTIDRDSPSTNYSGGPFVASNQTDSGGDGSELVCDETTPCDDFELTVTLPDHVNAHNPNARVQVALTTTAPADYDLYVLDNETNEYVAIGWTVGQSETEEFPVEGGTKTYTIRAVPYDAGPEYAMTVSLLDAFTLGGPELSTGADYEDPDTDLSFTLEWTRPTGATGPDLVERANSCSPFFTDDASSLSGWTSENDGPFAGNWTTSSSKPQREGNSTFWAQPTAEAGFGVTTLTLDAPIEVPETGTTTLTFSEFFLNEPPGCDLPGETGRVQVSADAGATWTTLYETGRFPPSPNAGAATYATEDLRPVSVDLSSFAGQSVGLRFRYEQDGCEIFAYIQYGWYIDDISISNELWSELLNDDQTSLTITDQIEGSKCYRVRTTYEEGQSEFSNVLELSVQNEPPIAMLAADATTGEAPLTVAFDGSGSTGGVASYTFDFGDGSAPVSQSDATIAHTYEIGGNFTATLSVIDTTGQQSAAPSEVSISVSGPPVANAGEDFEAVEGTTAGFDGSASADGNLPPLEFAWTQLEGPAANLTGANTATPQFTVPDVCESAILVFQLEASNGAGSSTDTVTVTAQPMNQAPVADAGPNGTAAIGQTFELDGSASADPDSCQVLTYNWTQVSGPTVELKNSDTVVASFVAPEVSDDTAIVFQLAVTDSLGRSNADQAFVVVSPNFTVQNGRTVVGETKVGGLPPFGLILLTLLGALTRRRR